MDTVSRSLPVDRSWHHLEYTVSEITGERESWRVGRGCVCVYKGKKKVSFSLNQNSGLVWESNPGPLAPEARIIPLDQQAMLHTAAMVMAYTGHG